MLSENVKALFASVEDLCAKYGRRRGEIKILAATKTVDCERMNVLPSLGITDVGENRVQEFREKYGKVANVNWHIIGELQTNKAKYVVGKTAMIHSLDRPSLADEIDRLSEKCSVISDVLIEVNMGGEQSKSGVSADGLDALYDYAAEKKNLRIRGLMSVLPIGADERLYERLYKLYEKKKGGVFDTLSAGMSGDYPIAIKHGANLIRPGSVIFGKRN